MTDELERRWDDAVEQAWIAYRGDLADHLTCLTAGESHVVEVWEPEGDDDGSTGELPYCQALSDGKVLRLEAVSNLYLDVDHQLSAQQQARLCDLGFSLPQDEVSPNFWVDLESRHADKAAWMVVTAMREVYGVLHPAWFSPAASPVGRGDDPGRSVEDTGMDGTVLREALTRVARTLVEGEPSWDSDGDLALPTASSVLYVVLARSASRILLSATLVTDVVDTARALAEVNLLNRRHYGLTFLLDDDRVAVRRELSVSTFAAGEVRAELHRMLEHLDGWVGDLRLRIGGRGLFDEDVPAGSAADEPERQGVPQTDRLTTALRVMDELQRDDRSSLTPEVLRSVFHADRALLVAAIDETRTREADARRRQRDHEEAGGTRVPTMLRAHARWQRELRSRLRRALRLTVRAAGRSESPEQLALFAEDDVAS